MPKYRLMANVSWIAGSKTDFGVYEFSNEDEAAQAAWDCAAQAVDAYVELVEDEDEGE